MKQKARFSPPAVGGSSLLAIFAILTLSVFAILALTTVNSDKRLADASVEAVSAYYAADLQTEEIYARLRNGETPPGVLVNENTYSYACPISEKQQLEVQLTCSGGCWSILRWQAVAYPEASPENTLPVWSGNTSQEETP